MIRKFLTVALVAAFGFSASACTKTGVQSVDAIIQKVQDAASKGCGFVPYVETILTAINALTGGKTPTGTQVTSIANKVCAAVAPVASSATVRTLMSTSAPLGTPTMVVNGATIPVKGYFVR